MSNNRGLEERIMIIMVERSDTFSQVSARSVDYGCAFRSYSYHVYHGEMVNEFNTYFLTQHRHSFSVCSQLRIVCCARAHQTVAKAHLS